MLTAEISQLETHKESDAGSGVDKLIARAGFSLISIQLFSPLFLILLITSEIGGLKENNQFENNWFTTAKYSTPRLISQNPVTLS